jgi:hypothetical protein
MAKLSLDDPALGMQRADNPPEQAQRLNGVHENDANAVALVNLEDTSREMAPNAGAHQRVTMGIPLKMNQWKFFESLESLATDAAAPFFIRTDFQNPSSEVFTNRFEETIDDNAILHEFHFVGIPEGRSRRMTKTFVDTAVAKSPILNNNQEAFATDHNKIIIAWRDFREPLKRIGKFDTEVDGWHLVNVKDGDNRIVSLYLRHVRLVDTDELQRYVATEVATNSWNPMTWNEILSLNALNIVTAKCFCQPGTSVHRLHVNCISHVTLRHLLTHLGCVYNRSINTTTFCLFLHVCSVLTPTALTAESYVWVRTSSSSRLARVR